MSSKRRKKPSSGMWIEEDDKLFYIFEDPTKIEKRVSYIPFDFQGMLLASNDSVYTQDLNQMCQYDSRKSRKLKKHEIVAYKLLGKLK